MVGLQSLRAYRDEAMQIATIDPSSLIKTNWDAYLQEYSNRVALPPNITRSDEEVAEIRQIQQLQQQQMMEMEQLQQGAGALKDMSQTDTAGQNLLTETAGREREVVG
jgi:hypothetical protein